MIFFCMAAVIVFTLHSSKNILSHYAENAFLKSQLDIFRHQKGSKRLRSSVFQKMQLASLYILLDKPKKLCYAFKPEAILRWHKKRVRKFWTFSSNKSSKGRPSIPMEHIGLILSMKKNNHLWGARRISAELVKLDIHVSKSTVAAILVKHGLDPTDYGLTWRKFLSSHINSIIACDFKTVTSVFGKRLYILFFISHQTREILHFDVTDSPNHRWMNQQLRNLRMKLDHDDKMYLIRDNDILYKYIDFKQYDFEDVPISIRSPDMNTVMERFIGSFKRDALDHLIIFCWK